MVAITALETELKKTIFVYLKEHDITGMSVSFERSKSLEHGDLTTNIAFQLAKRLKRAPLEVAEEIAMYIHEQKLPRVLRATAVAPGFVNIRLSPLFFAELLTEVEAEPRNFGRNNAEKGKVWAVEHTSPNPNKAMHLGHLRNNLVGMSVGRILEASGAKVIYEAIDNNRGIAIAKLMWGFLAHKKKNKETPTDIAHWFTHQDEWLTPEDEGVLPDMFVSECYIAGDTASKDPALEEKIRGLVVSWEAKDEMVWALWSHVLAYSYDGMERTLARLGNRWDHVWHEHEHYEKGKEWVMKGLAMHIFRTLEDGAVLTDLASYDIPDTILLKRDGTSLYITQDLALTSMKKEKYHADHLVWVIGPDQSLALRQLFAVCEQLGIGKVEEFTHVSYGYVGLKGEDGAYKKMSSRAGTVVLIDDVLDTVRDSIKKSEGLEDMVLAEKLALAAVKFSILKPNRTQDLTFDVERSIETKGDSGIYVMYTYVRAHSILKKARVSRKEKETSGSVVKESETAVGTLSESGETVLRLLLHYPSAVARGKEDLSAHHITQYLLEVAGAFNAWYAQDIILDGGAQEEAKLAVVRAVGAVLKNGMEILGIETVEAM